MSDHHETFQPAPDQGADRLNPATIQPYTFALDANPASNVFAHEAQTPIMPEMPTEHPDLLSLEVTPETLVKKCPEWARRFNQDPDGTLAAATRVAEKANEVIELRKQGMSDADITENQIAEQAARAREKANAEKSREAKAEAAREPKPKVEPAQEMRQPVPETPQPQEAAREVERVIPEPKLIMNEQAKIAEALERQRREQQEGSLMTTPEKPAETARQPKPSPETITPEPAPTTKIEKPVQQRTPIIPAPERPPAKNEETPTAQEPEISVPRPPVAPPEKMTVREFTPDEPVVLREVKTPQIIAAPTREHVLPVVDVTPSKTAELPIAPVIKARKNTVDNKPVQAGAEMPVPHTETIEPGMIDEVSEPAETTDMAAILQTEFSPDDGEPDTMAEQQILSPAETEGQPEITNQSENTSILNIDAETTEPALETLAEQTFVEFLEQQPADQEPVPLEAIMERTAEEQPLEQTLVQLAQLLATELRQPEYRPGPSEEQLSEPSPELIEIHAIFQDIAELLPRPAGDEEIPEVRLRLTPELTEKLLVLFGRLGYEQPGEVFIDFIRRTHNPDFLLQAVAHLCQQITDDYKELLPQISAPARPDSTARQWLHKLLSAIALRNLSIHRPLEPQLATY